MNLPGAVLRGSKRRNKCSRFETHDVVNVAFADWVVAAASSPNKQPEVFAAQISDSQLSTSIEWQQLRAAPDDAPSSSSSSDENTLQTALASIQTRRKQVRKAPENSGMPICATQSKRGILLSGQLWKCNVLRYLGCLRTR